MPNDISGESIMSGDEEKVERKKVTRKELEENYSFLKKFVIEYMGLTEKEAEAYISSRYLPREYDEDIAERILKFAEKVLGVLEWLEKHS